VTKNPIDNVLLDILGRVVHTYTDSRFGMICLAIVVLGVLVDIYILRKHIPAELINRRAAKHLPPAFFYVLLILVVAGIESGFDFLDPQAYFKTKAIPPEQFCVVGILLCGFAFLHATIPCGTMALYVTVTLLNLFTSDDTLLGWSYITAFVRGSDLPWVSCVMALVSLAACGWSAVIELGLASVSLVDN